jgi:DNA-binding PadR family transcriptional regulator
MMVVSMLSSSPKNGMEIMDGVEAITRGWWRPTPGSVYPLLEKMTQEGTIQKRADGRYELTPAARNEVNYSFGPRFRRPESVGDVVQEIKSLVSYLEDAKGRDSKELISHFGDVKEAAKRLSDLSDDSEEESKKT